MLAVLTSSILDISWPLMTSLSSYLTTASEFSVSHQNNRCDGGDDDKDDDDNACKLMPACGDICNLCRQTTTIETEVVS